MRVKTDTLNCNSGPGSIQCERTSFLASFLSSACKKNISFFLIGVSDTVFLKSCYRDMTCSFMFKSVDKKKGKFLHCLDTKSGLSHLPRGLTSAYSNLTGKNLLF